MPWDGILSIKGCIYTAILPLPKPKAFPVFIFTATNGQLGTQPKLMPAAQPALKQVGLWIC